MKDLTKLCLYELKVGLELHGTYLFDNKGGPTAVMTLDNLQEKLEALPLEEAVEVLVEIDLSGAFGNRASLLASDLANYLADKNKSLYDDPRLSMHFE